MTVRPHPLLAATLALSTACGAAPGSGPTAAPVPVDDTVDEASVALGGRFEGLRFDRLSPDEDRYTIVRLAGRRTGFEIRAGGCHRAGGHVYTFDQVERDPTRARFRRIAVDGNLRATPFVEPGRFGLRQVTRLPDGTRLRAEDVFPSGSDSYYVRFHARPDGGEWTPITVTAYGAPDFGPSTHLERYLMAFWVTAETDALGCPVFGMRVTPASETAARGETALLLEGRVLRVDGRALRFTGTGEGIGEDDVQLIGIEVTEPDGTTHEGWCDDESDCEVGSLRVRVERYDGSGGVRLRVLPD